MPSMPSRHLHTNSCPAAQLGIHTQKVLQCKGAVYCQNPISALLLLGPRHSGDYPVHASQFRRHAAQSDVLVLIAYVNRIDYPRRCAIITVIMCLAHCSKPSSIVVRCRLEFSSQLVCNKDG